MFSFKNITKKIYHIANKLFTSRIPLKQKIGISNKLKFCIYPN